MIKKIYEAMDIIPTNELKKHLQTCNIDTYDDIGARTGKRQLKDEIDKVLLKRSKRNKKATWEETHGSGLGYIEVKRGKIFRTEIVSEQPFVAVDVDKNGKILGLEVIIDLENKK